MCFKGKYNNINTTQLWKIQLHLFLCPGNMGHSGDYFILQSLENDRQC